MCRVVATYLGTETSRFDHTYYLTSHLMIAKGLLGPHGLQQVRVLSHIEPPADGAAGVIVSSEMVFSSRKAFDAAMQAEGEALFADLANFTDVMPLIQISNELTEA